MTRKRTSPSLLSFTAVCALAGLLAACSSTPTKAPEPPPAPKMTEAPPPPPPPAPPPPPPPPKVTKVEPVKPPVPEYLDPNSVIYRQRQIYFAFDQSLVTESNSAILAAHADFLSHHPTVHIAIEGNADERGSNEYNLALGQRRADSVAKALTSRGVSSGQLETRSWGKEKPVALGHDEESWAKNRRADLVYPDH